jgi:hypothetical protein
VGLFFSASAIYERKPTEVSCALAKFADKRNGAMVETGPKENSAEYLIIDCLKRNTFVMYPRDFFEWDRVSSFLSRELKTATLSLHVHDGDLWMYVLFVNGKVEDRFNPIPDYWAPISPRERAKWKGNTQKISKHWHVRADRVRKYLQFWSPTGSGRRAYRGDKCTFGDPWQLIDFMKRLSLRYPVVEAGVSGQLFEFSIPEHRLASSK